jgi:hypothetical protein
MKKVILLMLVTTFASSVNLAAQDDPFDPIIKAMKGSDARSLAASFNETVELILPDNENTYSVSQGEMIMKDFFKKHPSDSFTLIQKGTIDPASRFAICDYVAGDRQYQVYINLRKENDRFLIQKIKFEEKKK